MAFSSYVSSLLLHLHRSNTLFISSFKNWQSKHLCIRRLYFVQHALCTTVLVLLHFWLLAKWIVLWQLQSYSLSFYNDTVEGVAFYTALHLVTRLQSIPVFPSSFEVLLLLCLSLSSLPFLILFLPLLLPNSITSSISSSFLLLFRLSF